MHFTVVVEVYVAGRVLRVVGKLKAIDEVQRQQVSRFQQFQQEPRLRAMRFPRARSEPTTTAIQKMLP
jgi:hypothetical protein